MSNDERIDVTEDHDAAGNYVVRGGGEWAYALSQLAAKLGVPEDRLNFQLNPEWQERNRRAEERRRLNTPEAIRARTDFDVFDP